jgi:hypothetical protein
MFVLGFFDTNAAAFVLLITNLQPNNENSRLQIRQLKVINWEKLI